VLEAAEEVAGELDVLAVLVAVGTVPVRVTP
jgi:hypothetical protein